MGQALSEFEVSDHFKRGIDYPERTDVLTWNGSMTQETMIIYAKYLVLSLPKK
jgi:hypothetical protein